MARTYTTYLPDNGGQTCLPWIALTVICMSLAEKPLSRPEIVEDIAESAKLRKKKDVKASIYASVHSSIRKLEEMNAVIVTFRHNDLPRYKLSARGKQLFNQQLAEYDASNKLNTLSDSKVFT